MDSVKLIRSPRADGIHANGVKRLDARRKGGIVFKTAALVKQNTSLRFDYGQLAGHKYKINKLFFLKANAFRYGNDSVIE